MKSGMEFSCIFFIVSSVAFSCDITNLLHLTAKQSREVHALVVEVQYFL